jgi:uncharacterized SAM-binding protein YcdF (DUF218 family)
VILLFLLKQIGGPGSVGFLAVCCALGLFLIYGWPRNRRLGRVWLFALYCSYIAMGLPVVAHAIAAPMDNPDSGRQPIAPDFDTLVLLDGDNVVGRIGEARRLWEAAKPPVVILSGARWFVERSLEQGIPRHRVVLDESSGTTREQLEYLKKYQADHTHARLAVVASRLQMPRIIALADRAGVDARFYSAPVDREPATQGWLRFVPTYAGLRVTRDAFYERLAMAYYRRQGWIPAETPQRLAGTR